MTAPSQMDDLIRRLALKMRARQATLTTTKGDEDDRS